MYFFRLSLFLLIVGTLSCSSAKFNKTATPKDDTVVLWINGYKCNCNPTKPSDALFQVQETENIIPNAWHCLDVPIDGFEFKEGFIYKISVIKNMTADKKTLGYTFTKEIEKKIDPRLRLHDIWALTSIDQAPIKTAKVPTLEIHLNNYKIMGFDGCNSYRATLKDLSENNISFDKFLGTKMACPDSNIDGTFNQKMSEVRSYELKGLALTFYNDQKKEILQFKKVD